MVASVKDWWKKQDTEVSSDPSAPRSVGTLPEDGLADDMVDRSLNIRGTPSRVPTHDEIQQRAFEIYERSGRQDGHCERNWLQAEQELSNEARNGVDEAGTVVADTDLAASEF